MWRSYNSQHFDNKPFLNKRPESSELTQLQPATRRMLKVWSQPVKMKWHVHVQARGLDNNQWVWGSSLYGYCNGNRVELLQNIKWCKHISLAWFWYAEITMPMKIFKLHLIERFEAGIILLVYLSSKRRGHEYKLPLLSYLKAYIHCKWITSQSSNLTPRSLAISKKESVLAE